MVLGDEVALIGNDAYSLWVIQSATADGHHGVPLLIKKGSGREVAGQ